MPNAPTHDKITIASGAVLVPIAFVAQYAVSVPTPLALTNTALLVVAHVVSGTMFSPDLDIDSAIDNRWGIFFWIWRPYMYVVPHRNFWSHGLILPPLLRLLYFYVIVVILIVVSLWLMSIVGIILPQYHIELTQAIVGLVRDYPAQAGAFAVGFITGGAAHSLADWSMTSMKRRRSRYRTTHRLSRTKRVAPQRSVRGYRRR